MVAGIDQSNDDVFINCPFDEAYRPMFQAIVFAIYACGFRPRSGLEVDDGVQGRLERLYAIINACRYGVHDLSRTELDPVNQLPRFNMPLELGLFLGARRFGDDTNRRKMALILDTEQFRYQRFISDIAGMDIKAHDGIAENALPVVRNWLASVSRRKLPSGAQLLRLFGQFRNDLVATAALLELETATMAYVDFEQILINWLLQPDPAA